MHQVGHPNEKQIWGHLIFLLLYNKTYLAFSKFYKEKEKKILNKVLKP